MFLDKSFSVQTHQRFHISDGHIEWPKIRPIGFEDKKIREKKQTDQYFDDYHSPDVECTQSLLSTIN